MMRRVGVIVVLGIVVFGIVVQRRSQPDLAESIDRAMAVHADTVELVTASFGEPSFTEQSLQTRFCGGLGGPTSNKAMNLVAEWVLTDFEEERVTALLDEVEVFFSEVLDVGEPVRNTGIDGGFSVGIKGRYFSSLVSGPISPDARRPVVSVGTLTTCGDPSMLSVDE